MLSVLSILSMPINSKSQIFNCYDQRTSLEISQKQRKFCVFLSRMTYAPSDCNFEKGVQFQFRSDTLSYQLNETLNNFDSNLTKQVCFFCNSTLDINACQKIELTTLAYMTIQNMHQFSLIPIGLIIRENTNYSACYSHSDKLQTKMSSLVRFDTNYVCFQSVNTGFCQQVDEKENIESAILTVQFQNNKTMVFKTKNQPFKFERISSDGINLHQLCFQADNIFKTIYDNIFLSAQVRYSYSLQDIITPVYDTSFYLFVEKWYSAYQNITVKFLFSVVEVSLSSILEQTDLDQFNQQLVDEKIDKVQARLLIYPRGGQHQDQILTFEYEIENFQFFHRIQTLYSCQISQIDNSLCLQSLKVLFDTPLSEMYITQEIYLMSSNKVVHLITQPSTRVIISCIGNIQLVMYDQFQINFEINPQKASCPNIPGFNAILELRVHFKNQSQITLMKSQQYYDFNIKSMILKCEPDCLMYISMCQQENIFFHIFQEDGTIFDILNIQQKYNDNYNDIYFYGFIIIGISVTLSLIYGIYVIFFSQNIKPNTKKSKKIPVVNDIDEL
ncbi:hypothetical protein SS50377_24926 [Spironucleus salmonicida]|uniref:Transmembrane protein n=1 Tax=Spironucleus salmonicida TaxID=348837 RepID=V6LG18_9EUKA|nr:hypothetical protein SS50377_24926 [Spironucleus salmonicida]|eukprot:EST43457.1 Hypothetical protein SS50377_16821 [Spironucleus salmonicida]